VAPNHEHARPFVTVDAVLFAMRADDLAVLLVKRREAPYRGAWALPGGYVRENEGLEHAALRELEQETGVRSIALEQLGAYGEPGRDPRGHTVSVAFFTFVVAEQHPVRVGADAVDVAWHPLRTLALSRSTTWRSGSREPVRVAFDHARIIEHARIRLQERLVNPNTTTTFEIVPPRFTLTELQRVYEAVLGRALDKRNFRAKLLARGVVEPVSALRTGTHRPAQLYRWKPQRSRKP
jgi:8-oxo-dGTP diphosphatase